MKLSLNGAWRMKNIRKADWLECGDLPVSVYQTLLKNDMMENPFYGENEWKARELCLGDYDFCKEFSIPKEMLVNDKILLRFYGVDTIGEIYVNGNYIGAVDNMHRTYEFDVAQYIWEGVNTLLVSLKSPIYYAAEKYIDRKIWGVDTTINGYPHIRKAHYMMGWDWGPQAPDMGIWRDCELVGCNVARLKAFYVKQRFDDDYSAVTLSVIPELERLMPAHLTLDLTVTAPDGTEYTAQSKGEELEVTIDAPEFWFPRGYGEQPLYAVRLTLSECGEVLGELSEKIGIRTLTVRNDPSKSKFCFVCNGIEIFAMGADYIPQEQILPNLTNERITSFLEQCAEANFNTLRVWGGGYYPDDFFFEECDRLGFIVWQDFMFACAAYRLTDSLRETITAELNDNIRRIRNHACLGLWCGNNEIESMWEGWGIPRDDEAQEDYVTLFEEIIPKLLKKLAPETFYWPSSPSSGGNQYGTDGVFVNSSANDRGDQHYWDIWHNFKPLEEFRKFLFPFCSEYGFESIPSIKTIRSFAEEKDLNLTSPVIENHQKCTAGNEKLLYYVAQMTRYPYSFEKLIYATQLVQADAIRSDVEHLRRHRGRCMGSLYWQVNDCNPVISWSSIDYYGRWKGLHYAAKRFYAPVLLSCLEEDITAVKLNVCNETLHDFGGLVIWSICDNSGTVLESGSEKASVGKLSSADIATLNLSQLSDFATRRTIYLQYSLVSGEDVCSRGTALFVRPKEFEFVDPSIEYTIIDNGTHFVLTFTASAFAHGVCLELTDCDCVFSDNWFDLNGGEPLEIVLEKATLSREITAEELRAQMKITSCYDLM